MDILDVNVEIARLQERMSDMEERQIRQDIIQEKQNGKLDKILFTLVAALITMVANLIILLMKG